MLLEFIEDELECFSLKPAPIFFLFRTVLLFFHFYSDHQMSIKCNYLLVKYWLVLRNPLVADSYIISQLFLSTALTSITRNIVHTNFSLSSPVNYEKCAHSIQVKKDLKNKYVITGKRGIGPRYDIVSQICEMLREQFLNQVCFSLGSDAN